MALKKSQLYSSLWSSCNALRGGMDASQYKDYVLTLLFMKYVSDKSDENPDADIEVPEGGSFKDMVKLKGDKEIGEKINIIISKLAEANDLKGVIDQANFNDEDKLGRGDVMKDKLSKLVGIFEALDFRANRADGDDLLGDAYEYLMRHFATESGKSKGQFYTPAEVSRIMAKVIGVDQSSKLKDPTIYDPTCGSGSLLLKAADEATATNIALYGQEMDNATWALARMNMILHDHSGAELWHDNTLATPYFKNTDDNLKTFDYAVANPPFSAKDWSLGLDAENDIFSRFEYGIPPVKNGDYAFLLHLITSLKSKGKGAIILPHGVLFRGNKEADIRRKLIKRGLIKGIISLPANLFYGTPIPACIIVIDKEETEARTGIFMIDASKGFMKDGPKNRLRAQDIHRIVDVFTKGVEVKRFSRMVPVEEIASETNDYNLNIPRYIDSSEPEDLHDLDGHLNGGIPNRDVDGLVRYWSVFPSLRDQLFKGNGRDGYSEPNIEPQKVKPTILEHDEFKAYAGRVADISSTWRETHEPMLNDIGPETKPNEVIGVMAEDLLARFLELPLINRYDVYQRLMDYWDNVMQDDVYLMVADGWMEAAKPRGIIDDKEKKIKEEPDLIIKKKKYKMDLIPPSLIVARYFADEQLAINHIVTQQESAAQEAEEYIEENTGEDGLLEDTVNDKGKVTKGNVKDRLKVLKNEGKREHLDEWEYSDEYNAHVQCLDLLDVEAAAAKAVKSAKAELDVMVLAKYADLTESDIKELVVGDKWSTTILAAIEGEVQRLIRQLAGRVKELDERYAQTLPELEQDAIEYSTKVEGHLKKMGLVWE